MAVKGMASVRLVSGEAYNYKIKFNEVTAKYVNDVYISSKDLGFCHQLKKINDNEWGYLFSGEETAKFIAPITTSYSITIHSTEQELEPQILANQVFTVIKNKDKQIC